MEKSVSYHSWNYSLLCKKCRQNREQTLVRNRTNHSTYFRHSASVTLWFRMPVFVFPTGILIHALRLRMLIFQFLSIPNEFRIGGNEKKKIKNPAVLKSFRRNIGAALPVRCQRMLQRLALRSLSPSHIFSLAVLLFIWHKNLHWKIPKSGWVINIEGILGAAGRTFFWVEFVLFIFSFSAGRRREKCDISDTLSPSTDIPLFPSAGKKKNNYEKRWIELGGYRCILLLWPTCTSTISKI